RNILKAIRADQGASGGAQVLVGGATAIDVDVINFIIERTPLAIAVVVLITYLLLFLQTGSVVLPLKAVILNFLSIGASFGAAVFMAFGLAEGVIIKAIGVWLAIAVAIDATIVRSLVVPAVMRLLGDANWWAPRPLRWLHSRAGLSDLGVEERPTRIEPKSAPG